MNNKQEIEKSLKRYLKKKISYTFSLLIAFLITGGFATASELNQEVLLSRIKEDREKLEKQLQENYKKEATLNREDLNILKIADFYVKPQKGVLFSMPIWVKRVKSVNKEWQGSVRMPTEYDTMRKEFNSNVSSKAKGNFENELEEAVTYTEKSNNLSSGWLNKNINYGNSANAYDVEAKLFILPVVKAPVVNTPVAPTVPVPEPVEPTELNIATPNIINVNIPTITVSTPTVNIPTVNAPSSVTAPTLQEVKVNEPNININIATITVNPPVVEIPPALTSPNVNVNLTAATPPTITEPNPTVTAPESPKAPDFEVYVRARGGWLMGTLGQKEPNNIPVGGEDFKGNTSYGFGFNNFDRRIQRFINKENDNSSINVSINNAPFFATDGVIYGQGQDKSFVEATTNDKGVVTNKYNGIAFSKATVDLYPNNKFYIQRAKALVSSTPFPGVKADTFTSNEDNGAGLKGHLIGVDGSDITNGTGLWEGKNSVNHYSRKYQQDWIFQGSPDLVKDMTITVGGGPRGTAVFAQTRRVNMQDVTLNLKGKTVIADLDTQYDYVAQIKDSTINIGADRNTIFALSSVTPNVHRYPDSSNANEAKNWGVYLGDKNTKDSTLDFGTTDIKIGTHNNAVLYVTDAKTHRWIDYDHVYTSTGGTKYHINPHKYVMYYPTPGNIKFKNLGTNNLLGTDNAVAWINSYVPNRNKLALDKASYAVGDQFLEVGTINLVGDRNVGYYFAGNDTAPNKNGVFQGKVKVSVKIGETLDGTPTGTVQINEGNTITDKISLGGGKYKDVTTTLDPTKTEKNVGVFVASGQSPNMNKLIGTHAQYYPATLSFKVTGTGTSGDFSGLASGVQHEIGAGQLGTYNSIKDPIHNLDLTDFTVEFGEYSKGSIGLVAKNGSGVDLATTSGTINDNAPVEAEDNIMVYAEGVWKNPRRAFTGATYDDEAYGRGESETGKKYISDFNTKVNVNSNIEMGGAKSTAFFAKSGAIIDSTNSTVKITGHSSKGALAYSVEDYESKDIVDSDGKNKGAQPKTEIIVKSIEASADGTKDSEKKANMGAIAISQDGTEIGTGDVSVTVKKDVKVYGVGAFASGEKAKVTIEGKNSEITSATNGALVATNKGTINFGGGKINHEKDGDVAFYSEKKIVGGKTVVSHLNFTDATTLNISKGLVFYGDKEDYSKELIPASGETGRYTGMKNVTVNLTGNGVNLGVFKGITTVWNGNDAYLNDPTNGLKNIPKVAKINAKDSITLKDYWYKSTLEGGTITVKTDVNRDNISKNNNVGDGFNDISMQREKVIIDNKSQITSIKGNSMLLASNEQATDNNESGYNVTNGKISISGDKNTPTIGAYVNFGHIITGNKGTIEVNKGVATYGVNGSQIKNAGTIRVGDSSSGSEQGIGIMALAKTDSTIDKYGIYAGKATNPNAKWIDIENKGSISVGGTYGIGIYAKNNHNNSITKDKIAIHNEGTIAVGDKGKGIVVQTKNNTVTNGATLTLKDSGNSSVRDIKVGNEGIGVYAEYSDIKLIGDYGIIVGNKGVAIQTKGTASTLTQNSANDILNVEYKGTVGGGAMAIAYGLDNPATEFYTNKINLNLINTDKAKGLTGIYTNSGTKLVNQGNITTANYGSYGILSDKIDVENTGKITVGSTSSTDSSNAIGIYVKNAKLTTDGDKITIEGNGSGTNSPVGIFAKSDNNLNTVKNIMINQGTNALTINGKKGIGIFIEDESNGNDKLKLINSSKINLSDSATKSDRKIAIMLKNARNTDNLTSEKIIVRKNNIGIYNESSIITHTGILEVKHNEAGTENIGAHNTGNGFKFIVKKVGTNTGFVDVEGQNGTIGISAVTGTTGSGEISLIDATFNINAPDKDSGKIPLGIYGEGNNILVSSIGTNATKFTVSPNAIGMYIKGNNTSKINGLYDFSLSSENTKDSMGIGAYLTGGVYFTTGTNKLKMTSTLTASNSDGAIRPIGIFYGTGSTKNEANIDMLSTSKELIGIYGKDSSSFENLGTIEVNPESSMGAYFTNSNVTNKAITTVNGEKSYGWYLKGGSSSTTAKIEALAKNSVAVLLSGKGFTGTTSFENQSGVEILANADKAIGVYAEEGAKYINKGILNSLNATSIGGFAVNATLVNDTNATVNSKYVALYGKTSSTIENSGTININANNKTAVIADTGTTVNLKAGKITSANDNVTGIVADNKSVVNLLGGNIELGKDAIGINSTNNSTVNLTDGNIQVGEKGLGVYTKDGTVNLISYIGKFILGKSGIGIYSKDSTVNGGTLKVDYNHNDLGVGIYYDGGTVTNSTTVSHTGQKLVNIFSNASILTNTANQEVQTESIGIYAKGGVVVNNSTIKLTGDNVVGIYLNDNSKLNEIGTITGNAPTTSTAYKVGVYVNKGSVEGSKDYNFGVNNGVAMYLDTDGVNNSTGKINLSANSVGTGRAIGIYITPTTTTRNINTSLNITGKDAVGLFLKNGSNINYGGTLDISSNSSDTVFGIGASIDKNSTFTLASTGKVKIGGLNNIGFYVKEGGILQVSGGTVENTKDGIFAYLENGKLDFKAGAVPNINFLNTFVSGSKGSIENSTTITVGTAGLQASDGAKIINNTSGTINGVVDGAKALVGTGTGSTIKNKGDIKLTGANSVALYANNNASGLSTGLVEVGKNSVAYYTNDNGKIDVSGITKIGEGSSVFYVNSGQINYNGSNIVLPNKATALTLTGNSPTTKVDFNNKNITVGEGGTGIYITKNGESNSVNNVIQNLAKITVGKFGNAIYLNNDNNFSSSTAIDLVGEDSIGILSKKNGNIINTGDINSNFVGVKAILHKGNGDTTNNGIIKINGDSSIGVYAEGNGILKNTNLIEIGKGTSTSTSVGLYGKDQTAIINSGNIKMLSDSIGIYGENTTITNTGSIQNSGLNNNAIYAKNSNVNNSGNISLGDSSNGIYATSTTPKIITNKADIKVGGNQSSAIFGDGKTGINNISGDITVGKNSVGLATREGNITTGPSTKFNIGQESTYIYSQKGNIVNNANFNLSKYSSGIYTEEGTAKNYGTLIVGESSVGDKKISVAMATGKGNIENFGNISIPDKHGVGMVANEGGTAINRAGGTITVDGESAFGLQATKGSTLLNEGTINVNGNKARGMAATNKSKIINASTGVINVNGTNSEGIYVDYGSTVSNKGNIIVNSTTGIGIFQGAGGVIENEGNIVANVGERIKKEGASQLKAADITIVGPKAYIDNVEIHNSGTITINGALNFNEIKLGSVSGNIGTINATSFNKGKFIILPNATLGSNKDMYTIQYLGGLQNIPNNGSISAISHSATFVADIQKDEHNPKLVRIVMVRVPYSKLTQNTAAAEFGKGLDDLYKNLGNISPQNPKKAPHNTELDMFDALKMISNKDQLGATFDNELRGNVYANVQRRMLDINENFYNSYENLKNSDLYARKRLKIAAIITAGASKDKNPAVEDYKTRTTGLAIMKEKDFITYGRSADVSLAFTETNFKFDFGSKEKVHSLQLGAGFENFITDKNWKYSTRGEFTVNRHNMKRKIHLSNGTYQNNGKYWSETLEWKNKLRYETSSASGLVTAGAFGTFNLGYGRFNGIKENGDGMELQIKSNNMYMVRPGVGVDLALNYYTKGGKISLIGIATAEYELGKVYDGVNQARVKNSNAGYYDLEKPKEIKDIYKVGAQIQYKTNAGHQIGVGVTREEGSVKATKFGVNAVYKF